MGCSSHFHRRCAARPCLEPGAAGAGWARHGDGAPAAAPVGCGSATCQHVHCVTATGMLLLQARALHRCRCCTLHPSLLQAPPVLARRCTVTAAALARHICQRLTSSGAQRTPPCSSRSQDSCMRSGAPQTRAPTAATQWCKRRQQWRQRWQTMCGVSCYPMIWVSARIQRIQPSELTAHSVSA